MAYDRQASAAANLAAAGIARARGVSAYTQWRRLAPATRAAAIATRVQRDTNYRPGGSQARLGRPARRRAPLRTVDTAAGTIAYTGSQQVVIDLLRAARTRGHLVAFRANFLTDQGEPRTRIIDGNAAQLDALATAVEAGPRALAGPKEQRPLPLDRHTLPGRRNRPGVEVRTGTRPGTYAPGMDPNEVLALIDAFAGDVWAALYVLWAVGYE